MSRLRSAPSVLFLFYSILAIVLILNATMTAVFGANNLWAAFSSADSLLPRIAGALYALVIFDFAALAYFAAYRNVAETTIQRFMTISIAIVCLAGSIFATVEQLTATAFGLAVFEGYTEVIQFIALVFMISLTATHAVAAAAFGLFSIKEQIHRKGIALRSQMIDDALSEAEQRVQADTGAIVDQLSADYRREVLHVLGFTDKLQRVLPARTSSAPLPIRVGIDEDGVDDSPTIQTIATPTSLPIASTRAVNGTSPK